MISAVVLTKNEEKNIKECLKTLSFCGEIIVVDDNSIDKTVQTAKKMGAVVYERSMNMNYSEQSNYGMNKAKGDWILFIDADERVSTDLKKEIIECVKSIQFKGYFFKRWDYMWGKWLKHGESGTVRVMRLVRKNSGFWKRRVHPHYELKGDSKSLLNPLYHYAHPSISSFLVNINRWSTWHAIANKEEGKSSSIIKIIFWPIAHFLRNFIFRRGFLDGMQGFVFSILMSFHSYLAWSKLWMLQKGYSKI